MGFSDGESWDWIRIITTDKYVWLPQEESYKRIGFESICTFSLWLQISFSLHTKSNPILITTVAQFSTLRSLNFDHWNSLEYSWTLTYGNL